MEFNITSYLDAVKTATLANINISKGIIAFFDAIEGQRNRTGERESTVHLQNENEDQHNQLLAIQALIQLTTKAISKRLPIDTLLDTKFHIENAKPDDELHDIERGLIEGIESLVQILSGVKSSDPLLPWAKLAIATNFLSSRDHNNIVRSEASRVDQEQPARANNAPPIDAHAINESHIHSPLAKLVGNSEVDETNMDSLSHHALGIAIEQHYGCRHDLLEDESLPGYKRALANWRLLLLSVIFDDERHRQFWTRLSPAQILSARLLVEWWFDELSFDWDIEKAFSALETAFHTGSLSHGLLELFKVPSATISNQRTSSLLQRFIFDFNGPPYHCLMFRLFQLELLPCHYLQKWSQQALDIERPRAARLAACQRLSVSWSRSTSDYDRSDVDVRHHSKVPESVSTSETAPALRGMCGLRISTSAEAEEFPTLPIRIQREQLSDVELHRVKDFIRPKSSLNVGAAYLPCMWLDPSNPTEDHPYYLWDRIDRRTVIAGKLIHPVEYTAISHTWGRWKYHDYQAYPKIYLRGLTDWSIPQNSKFNVEEIPDILNNVPFPTRYIWFDLVCIPQEPEDQKLIRVSKQEIARQAKIFRCAKFAVAWFNDVEDWTGIQAAISRLSCHFLLQGNDETVLQSRLVQADAASDLNVELFNDTSTENEAPEDCMNPWFSSMWTLQELCLRPDMRLCDKRWKPLSIGTDVEVLMGMEDLIALAEGGNFSSNSWDIVGSTDTVGASTSQDSESLASSVSHAAVIQTTGTRQIWELLDLSGLEHLLTASRATILTLGNQRYCERNRAEAIMSAVGVVDWYEKSEMTPETPSGYPLAFIREAAAKLGAEFFSLDLAVGELLEMLILSLGPLSSPRIGVGSLVPYTSSKLSRSPSLVQGCTAPEHPSVSTWSIEEDDSVSIRQIGLLSYTGQHRQSGRPKIVCTMVAPELSKPISLRVKKILHVDLDNWVDSFLPGTRNFATCLHAGFGICDGILLKELTSGELIKVGTYHIPISRSRSLPPPENWNVNWRVL